MMISIHSQRTVSAYLQSKQKLPFGFAGQYASPSCTGHHRSLWYMDPCFMHSVVNRTRQCQRPRGHSSTAGEVVRGLLVTLAEETWRAQHPANTRHWTNTGFMLGQRRRRWPNFNPALAQSAKGSWTKKAVAAYFNSKQLLPIGFAHTYHCGGDKCSSSYPHLSNDRAEATGGATSANYSHPPPHT